MVFLPFATIPGRDDALATFLATFFPALAALLPALLPALAALLARMMLVLIMLSCCGNNSRTRKDCRAAHRGCENASACFAQ